MTINHDDKTQSGVFWKKGGLIVWEGMVS